MLDRFPKVLLLTVTLLGADLARAAVDLLGSLMQDRPELRLLGSGRMTWYGSTSNPGSRASTPTSWSSTTVRRRPRTA